MSEVKEILQEYCGDPGNWKVEMQESSLSEKEYLVYRLRNAGLKRSEIAEILEIGDGTVDGKLGRIRKKIHEARQTMNMVQNWGKV